jgi:hypothetical protein
MGSRLASWSKGMGKRFLRSWGKVYLRWRRAHLRDWC